MMMANTMKTALSIGLFLALAPCTLAGQDNDKYANTVTTTLTKMRQAPEAFRHVKVTFLVQFASIGHISNPFFTRFVPSDYANFYCWGDDQPIWRKSEYGDVFAFLFLSKDNDQLQELYDLRLYERVQITGVVRNTFQGAPWVEVLDFYPIGEQVTTAGLAHLYRGERHMARRQWQRAVSELTLAPVSGVPVSMEAAVHKNLGICYLRMGESDQAVYHLSTAVSLNGERDLESNRLLASAETRPELELDRVVNPAELKDHERPLWEVFQGFDSLNRPAGPGGIR